MASIIHYRLLIILGCYINLSLNLSKVKTTYLDDYNDLYDDEYLYPDMAELIDYNNIHEYDDYVFNDDDYYDIVGDNDIVSDNDNDNDNANDNANGNDNYIFLISGGYLPLEVNLTHYMVSIRTRHITQFFGDNHFCTGVIVSRLIVLTTAHCLVDRYGVATRAHRLVVVAGCPVRLEKNVKCMEYMVHRVIPHQDFRRHQGNDIAVLVLEKNIASTNPDIKIISLARVQPAVKQICKTMGWGQLYWDGPFSNNAIYVDLIIEPPDLCRKNYTYNLQDLLCAGSHQWEVGICRGDSGTPLICGDKLVGIASESRKCADWKPVVYTDISHHYSWILQMSTRGTITQTNPFMLIILLYFILTVI